MTLQQHNPCGLDGFAFLEFSGPNPALLHRQFQMMGFKKKASHRKGGIHRYQQGDIEFIINESPDTQAAIHAKTHGAGASAMGFRVQDANKAYDYAISQGAKPFEDPSDTPHHLPGIQAIGGSVIFFVDASYAPFKNDWVEENITDVPTDDCGLCLIDHLTHNVYRGNMDKWADFYESIFNFKEIRFFNIEGQMTGLISRALGSPCGKIKIPLNESKDSRSQIEEFLHEYQGEGIQHIALTTQNIYKTVQTLKENGVGFLDVPDTYYEMIAARIPWHEDPVDKLKQGRILIDGESEREAGLLLQIFTENVFGPVFFEIIQRQGNQGFGEGNFKALFEAIERDQMKRGTL